MVWSAVRNVASLANAPLYRAVRIACQRFRTSSLHDVGIVMSTLRNKGTTWFPSNTSFEAPAVGKIQSSGPAVREGGKAEPTRPLNRCQAAGAITRDRTGSLVSLATIARKTAVSGAV